MLEWGCIYCTVDPPFLWDEFFTFGNIDVVRQYMYRLCYVIPGRKANIWVGKRRYCIDEYTFLQALCHMLQTEGRNRDLLSILTRSSYCNTAVSLSLSRYLSISLYLYLLNMYNTYTIWLTFETVVRIRKFFLQIRIRLSLNKIDPDPTLLWNVNIR